MNRNSINQWGIFRKHNPGTETTYWKDIPEGFVGHDKSFSNEPFLFATRAKAQEEADSCTKTSSAFNYHAQKFHFRKGN